MSSLDIWSHDGSFKVRDLLISLLSIRLLSNTSSDPVYVSSPYLTDFPVFDNEYGQFEPLFQQFAEFGQQSTISFSQTLIELSTRQPVRIIGVAGDNADAFHRTVVRPEHPGIEGRYAVDLQHEKGLLCSDFYLQGSMNITYKGVYLNGEKITVYAPSSEIGKQKVSNAILEFDRLWKNREQFKIPLI